MLSVAKSPYRAIGDICGTRGCRRREIGIPLWGLCLTGGCQAAVPMRPVIVAAWSGGKWACLKRKGIYPDFHRLHWKCWRAGEIDNAIRDLKRYTRSTEIKGKVCLFFLIRSLQEGGIGQCPHYLPSLAGLLSNKPVSGASDLSEGRGKKDLSVTGESPSWGQGWGRPQHGGAAAPGSPATAVETCRTVPGKLSAAEDLESCP